jgi:hypothetical protein
MTLQKEMVSPGLIVIARSNFESSPPGYCGETNFVEYNERSTASTGASTGRCVYACTGRWTVCHRLMLALASRFMLALEAA